MKWIALLEASIPADIQPEALLVLFDNGEWRRYLEDDLPGEVITHYAIIPKLGEECGEDYWKERCELAEAALTASKEPDFKEYLEAVDKWAKKYSLEKYKNRKA